MAGIDFWVAYEDQAQLTQAMRVATSLRRSGASAEYALKPQNLARQLKTASAAGALAAVILRASGEMVQKDLASGMEEPFTFPNG
jgi:histidyl-tRNA synthetase